MTEKKKRQEIKDAKTGYTRCRWKTEQVAREGNGFNQYVMGLFASRGKGSL
jgi:hypothetical protein